MRSFLETVLFVVALMFLMSDSENLYLFILSKIIGLAVFVLFFFASMKPYYTKVK